MAAASEQINAVANQSAQASQQVAATTHEVAQGAQEQARVVGGASRTVSDISAMIAQVSAMSAATSQRAAEVARGHGLRCSASWRRWRPLRRVCRRWAVRCSRCRTIGVIVETVDDIAARDQPAALNAAIEVPGR